MYLRIVSPERVANAAHYTFDDWDINNAGRNNREINL